MDSIDLAGNQNPETPLMKPAIEYSLLFALITIALFAAGHYGGFDLNSMGWKIVNWVISISMVAWLLWNFREKKNEGFLKFGQGVKLSVLVGIFTGIIGGILMYVFVTTIAPEFMTNVENQAIMAMQEQGLTDEQIKESLKMTSMFFSPGAMVLFSILGSVFSYLILGLIFSAILKRD